MKWSFALSFLSATAVLAGQPFPASTYTIPNSLFNGSVSVEFTSGIGQLDGQKITPQINDTTYEWWYFDAVSLSTNESVVAVFYESSPDGFVGGVSGYPIAGSLSGTFKNGTTFSISVPASLSSNAVITTSYDGASGTWGDTGFSFAGTPYLTSYTVSVNNEAYGACGTLTLTSIAPAHYPCGKDAALSTEVICPHVGWSNAIPGAIATASFTIDGEEVTFTGVGYHDKNWGDISFVKAVTSWYWGHAALGPYTLVWFDALSSDGDEYVSGYVSESGTIVGANCTSGSLVVRPFGANDDYPPTPESGTPTGFAIDFTLADGSKFMANATTGLETITEGSEYGRYIGDITGGVVGGTQYSGRALWEQFKF